MSYHVSAVTWVFVKTMRTSTEANPFFFTVPPRPLSNYKNAEFESRRDFARITVC